MLNGSRQSGNPGWRFFCGRNVNAAWRIALELGNKADLLEIGRAVMVEKKEGNSNAAKTTLSQNDKVDSPPSAPFPDDDDDDDTDVPFTTAAPAPPKHDTRKQLAAAAWRINRASRNASPSKQWMTPLWLN